MLYIHENHRAEKKPPSSTKKLMSSKIKNMEKVSALLFHLLHCWLGQHQRFYFLFFYVSDKIVFWLIEVEKPSINYTLLSSFYSAMVCLISNWIKLRSCFMQSFFSSKSSSNTGTSVQLCMNRKFETCNRIWKKSLNN